MATKKTPSREEFAAGMKKAAEETQKELTKKTEEVKDAAKKTAEKTTEAAKKTTTAAKKTAAKKTSSAKAVVKKTAATAKKKVAEKTAEVKATAIVQFGGTDHKVEDIIKAAEAAYKAENKNKALKSIRVYIKPEDGAAYYVANDDYAGKIDL